MKEFEEDNLENFFRNRAEGDQYDFREVDWAKMATKLDTEDAAAGFSLSKYFWMAVGAAITFILFLGYIQFNKFAGSASVSPNFQVVDPTKPVAPAQQKALADATSKEADKENSVSSTIMQAQRFAQKSDNSAETITDNAKTQNNYEPSTATKVQHKSAFNKMIVTNPAFEEIKLDRSEEMATGVITKVPPGSTNPNSVPITSNILAADTIRATYLFSDISTTPIILHKKKLPEEIKIKRFYTLSLVAAMDITSTSESDWGKPVLRIGLNGEYFLSNHFSVGLGINISDKEYAAKGQEYSPTKGFWTYGIIPDSTYASCKVLDVPLTLSYYHPIGIKGSLIFHAGMSSWFMLEEDYYYKYNSNDPHLIDDWHGTNENRYWFGIVNLAISYEQMINNKWAVIVGPYYNIPLTGIGHGNVELTSFGIRSSLRYHRYRLPRIK